MADYIKTKHGRYGFCFVEQIGRYYYVHVGKSTYGPYDEREEALREFERWAQ